MANKKKSEEARNAIIMGAAGRDFHNFNTFFRNNPVYNVVCFTATQIPNISGRKYPPALAGKMYPDGIPILPEEQMTEIIREKRIDDVFFSYSDVSHEYVMHKASEASAAGASFILLGPNDTQIKSSKPVIAVCAVRTGSGKSQTSQKIAATLKEKGKRVAVVRHPMPYGDLASQAVQRFASYKDLDDYDCTVEEREEYEPYIEMGMSIYAGVDYEKILRKAEKEADIIIWDGGNNDFPFYKPDKLITVADPLRAGHELIYHPGETNFRMADYILINKEDSAEKSGIRSITENAKRMNPKARILHADSEIHMENPEIIKGKKVLVIEDGPTLTHGEMEYGAGFVAARRYGAKPIDPRKYAVGSIKATFKKYSHITRILPAMGYGNKQLKELEQTIRKAKCDAVIIATPIKLENYVKMNKPHVHVRYRLKEKGWKMESILRV